jgi:hypothetical protein
MPLIIPDDIEQFTTPGEGALLLARMQGRRITLPANAAQRPAKQHLKWHRDNRFLGSKHHLT